ncbi:flagellar biosynthesis anti-sigma factor FlgM [Dethiosulfovibrio salsuginis]|uniref:Negative regulator of flagellin synthesis n=1 Tax=Dethiosulfovibrio salsuginis TaxID=561720 RepID=A0A1X7IVZ6_9BACT|nr:flagellar biosynthesis anti-sigma factor FlgM [Dethiosulfovibrio salsuginis]SMG18726.1 anti-sigma-28 factor, FlgM family [Dethiosulfovibrio salsuginis]
MIDKIGPSYTYTVSKAVKKSNPLPKEQDRNADGLEVSGFGQVLSRSMAEAKKIPDVRQDKVDGIKNRIESGTYNPDNRFIAARLIAAGILED